ncbi:MAG: MerR family transcriptional regulator [Myxococcota bacterium]
MLFVGRGGVTVRTLHHYDEVGLLTPSSRESSSGHRVYDERDAKRLARIVMLRAVGFSLDEIKAALARRRRRSSSFASATTPSEKTRSNASRTKGRRSSRSFLNE